MATCNCAHCDVLLTDVPTHITSGVVWCKVCHNENEALLREKGITFNPTLSNKNAAVWEGLINTTSLREIPKKIIVQDEPLKEETPKEEVKEFPHHCDHCDAGLMEIPWGGSSYPHVVWCKACCDEELEFFKEKAVPQHPSRYNKECYMWQESQNVERLRAHPKIVRENKTLENTTESSSKEEVKTEVKKTEAKMAHCDHCADSVEITQLPDLTIYWCGECVKNDRALLEKERLSLEESSLDNYKTNGFEFANTVLNTDKTIKFAGWKSATGLKSLANIPKKGAVKTVEITLNSCAHCDKALNTTALKANNYYTIYWCGDCIEVDGEALKKTNAPLYVSDNVHAVDGKIQYAGWKSYAPTVKAIPNKKTLEEARVAAKIKADDDLTAYAKLVEEQVAKADAEAAAKIAAMVQKTIEEALKKPLADLTSKIESVESAIKSEEKKATTICCQHCDKDLADKKIYGDSSSSSFLWCGDCVIAEEALLISQNIRTIEVESYKNGTYGGEGYFSPSEISILKEIPKKGAPKKAAVGTCNCEYCSKELDKSKVWNDGNRLSSDLHTWCKECVDENRTTLANDHISTLASSLYQSAGYVGEVFEVPDHVRKLQKLAHRNKTGGSATNCECTCYICNEVTRDWNKFHHYEVEHYYSVCTKCASKVQAAGKPPGVSVTGSSGVGYVITEERWTEALKKIKKDFEEVKQAKAAEDKKLLEAAVKIVEEKARAEKELAEKLAAEAAKLAEEKAAEAKRIAAEALAAQQCNCYTCGNKTFDWNKSGNHPPDYMLNTCIDCSEKVKAALKTSMSIGTKGWAWLNDDEEKKVVNDLKLQINKQCHCYICSKVTKDWNAINNLADTYYNVCLDCAKKVYYKTTARTDFSLFDQIGIGFRKDSFDEVEAINQVIKEKNGYFHVAKALHENLKSQFEIQKAKFAAEYAKKNRKEKVTCCVCHVSTDYFPDFTYSACSKCAAQIHDLHDDGAIVAKCRNANIEPLTNGDGFDVEYRNAIVDAQSAIQKVARDVVGCKLSCSACKDIIRRKFHDQKLKKVAMAATTEKKACPCCNATVPGWEGSYNGKPWISVCQPCTIKVLKAAGKEPSVYGVSAAGLGLAEEVFGAAIKTVTAEVTSEKASPPTPSTTDIAAALKDMLESIDDLFGEMKLGQDIQEDKLEDLLNKIENGLSVDQAALDQLAKTLGSKVPPNLQKMGSAKRIIDALDTKAYVFGSFIRDALSFEDFSNIDLFFPLYDKEYDNKYDEYLTCISKLTDLGYSITEGSSPASLRHKKTGVDLMTNSYVATDANGTAIQINLVRTNAVSANKGYDNPFLLADADVNSLFFDKKTNSYKAANGLDINKVVRNCENKVFELPSDSTIQTDRINKLTEKGYKPIKDMTIEKIEKNALKVGDKISIIVTNPTDGTTATREAIVFSVKPENVRTVLSSSLTTAGNSWVLSSSELIEAQKVGTNPGAEPLGWQLDVNTEIKHFNGNIFPPPLPIKNATLTVGDKVDLRYYAKDAFGKDLEYVAEGIVLFPQSESEPIVAIPKGVLKEARSSVTIAAGTPPSAKEQAVLKEMGLDVSTHTTYPLDDLVKAFKVLGKVDLPPIDQGTLQIGDKIEVEINLKDYNYSRTDEKIIKTAWVVGISSGYRQLALETPLKPADGSTNPCYGIADYTDYLYEAKRLGLTINDRTGWKVNVNNTKIRKILEKAPPLVDPKTVEVGDKLEVEVAPGRVGTAICIEKDAYGTNVYGFEKVPGTNLNVPGANHKALYQKYGLANGYTLWMHEGGTKIRKKLGKAETYLEHKSLAPGDVIDFNLRYNSKMYPLTGIVAEIHTDGRPIVTTATQVSGITGTSVNGLWAHAAKKAGWDPAKCGAWTLQTDSDQVIVKGTHIELGVKPLTEFKVGDLIEVEIIQGAVNFTTEALVGALYSNGVTGLILKNRSDLATNCDAALTKVAHKYGFEAEGTMYNVNSGMAVVHKSFGKANVKSIAPNTLKVGDRIEVCFGHETPVTAVVLQDATESVYKEPIVAFESENNNCWELDQKQKDIAFKYGLTGKKIGRRIDGSSTFVTNVLGRKGLSAGNLKPGDRLKLELAAGYESATPLPEEATVIASSGNAATVVFNEVYRDTAGLIANSQFPTKATQELAKAIGIELADNDARVFSFTNGSAIIIKEVNSPTKAVDAVHEDEDTINPNSIQTGDRVLIEIKDLNGKTTEEYATALGVDYGGFPLVYLDDDYAKAFVFEQASNVKACQALGFDPKERRGLELNPARTKIIEICSEKHEIATEDLKIGDRILVEFMEDEEALFTKEGIYVGEEEDDGYSIIYFTEVIATDNGDSWSADKNTVPYLAAKKLGFNADADQYMTLSHDMMVRKYVSKWSGTPLLQNEIEDEASDLRAEAEEEEEEADDDENEEEYVNPYDLEVGDKVQVKISSANNENEFVLREAVCVDPDHADGPLIALNSTFKFEEDENEVEPVTLKSLGKEFVKTAKKLDINPDKKVAWNFDDYTLITKVLSKSNNNSADAQNNNEETMPTDSEGEEMTIVDMLKNDAMNAGYRVAANQMTKGVKGALLLSMRDKGVDGGKIQAVSEMLDTEMGEALISTLLGYGLTYIPGLSEDPRAQTLAEEFRINGIATAGNVLADSLFQHLLPAINSAMSSLPPIGEITKIKKPGRKRVATPKVETVPALEAGDNDGGKAASKSAAAHS